jgi:hypothetical protein
LHCNNIGSFHPVSPHLDLVVTPFSLAASYTKQGPSREFQTDHHLRIWADSYLCARVVHDTSVGGLVFVCVGQGPSFLLAAGEVDLV